jgi:hypothetical protein
VWKTNKWSVDVFIWIASILVHTLDGPPIATAPIEAT